MGKSNLRFRRKNTRKIAATTSSEAADLKSLSFYT